MQLLGHIFVQTKIDYSQYVYKLIWNYLGECHEYGLHPIIHNQCTASLNLCLSTVRFAPAYAAPAYAIDSSNWVRFKCNRKHDINFDHVDPP